MLVDKAGALWPTKESKTWDVLGRVLGDAGLNTWLPIAGIQRMVAEYCTDLLPQWGLRYEGMRRSQDRYSHCISTLWHDFSFDLFLFLLFIIILCSEIKKKGGVRS